MNLMIHARRLPGDYCRCVNAALREYAGSALCEKVDAPIVAAHPIALRILERMLAQVREPGIAAHSIRRGVIHVWKRVHEPVLAFFTRERHDGNRRLCSKSTARVLRKNHPSGFVRFFAAPGFLPKTHRSDD